MNKPEPASSALSPSPGTSSAEHLPALLEQRLSLLEALSEAIAATRAACITGELEALRAATGEQQHLCAQLLRLDRQLRPVLAPGVAPAQPETLLDRRLRDILARLKVAQNDLHRQNAAQQSLLRRSRRHLRALANFYRRYASTYAETAAPQAGTLCEERV